MLQTATTMNVIHIVGKWENVAALIDRIDIIASSNNFAANSILTFEGCRLTT